ncbi:hypothetical protein [Bacillus sp. B15-48]|uniref:hypothetical protein n=1 Tax=Bacillus sp. B15-48 TaxID=1548601 RepID=UPI00193F4BD1|nr:hypothetical protein [Bacillus sp. B15-48]MBM4765013.1 hypothetical protein [Bacillus sp. B15-48]
MAGMAKYIWQNKNSKAPFTAAGSPIIMTSAYGHKSTEDKEMVEYRETGTDK